MAKKPPLDLSHHPMPGFESIEEIPVRRASSSCPRCGALIPPGLLVCGCFALAAEEETLNNAARQYKTGEITLSMPGASISDENGAHILIPGKGRAFCGGKFQRKGYLSMPYDRWVNMKHCAACDAEIERRTR